MEGMETFLSYFLVHWGISVLLNKFNASERIRKLSNRIKSKFLYDMSECEFCITHHAGIIPVLVMLLFGFEWIWLVYPFMGASLMNLIRETIQKDENDTTR